MGEICYHCFQVKSNSGPCERCGYDPQSIEGTYPTALPEGTILNGKYIVGHVLGRGGFGVTYIAQDYQTKGRVAIKEYFPGELSTRTGSYRVTAYSGQRENDFLFGKELFLEEAKTIAAFNSNPHIVNVYQFFEEESTKTAYFVMEYVDGVSLENYVKSKGGRLSPEEANDILLPLMEAVRSIHQKGIVHRDIAPDNILLSKNGHAKLIDFGAARASTGQKSMSMDVVVKHGFAPREQYASHGKQGPYTDVYSMAATWYYAITGRVPPDSIDRIDEDGLIRPSVLGVQLSEKQTRALLKALEIRPEDRYQDIGEFAQDLNEGSIHRTTTREDLLLRAFAYLEKQDWDKADSYLRTLADLEPDNAMAYLGRLMAQLQVAEQEDLKNAEPFDENQFYIMASRFADPDLQKQLQFWAGSARNYWERKLLGEEIQKATQYLSKSNWELAKETFGDILGKDPQHAAAHFGMLMAELNAKTPSALGKAKEPFVESIHYTAVMNGKDDALKEQLQQALQEVYDSKRKREERVRFFRKWKIAFIAAPLAVLCVIALLASGVLDNSGQIPYEYVPVSGAQEEYDNGPEFTVKVSSDSSQLQIAYRSNTDLKKVVFPVWSEEGGQDDLFWYPATRSADGHVWNCQVPLERHRSAGTYYIHVYEDKDGHRTILGNTEVKVARAIVPTEHIVANINADHTMQITLYTQNTYKKVSFPVWSEVDDQDDIVWYKGRKNGNGQWSCQVNLEDHGAEGLFYVHAYADRDGEMVFLDGITRNVS